MTQIYDLIAIERDKSVRELLEYLKTKESLGVIDPTFKSFIDQAFAYLIRGGKMHRPLLTRLAFDLVGRGKSSGNIWLGSLAPEVFHRFLLCHDDIIDQDLIRHGQPTLEKIYQDELESLKPAKPMVTFPLAMAMESGDLIHALTYDIILAAEFPLEVSREVIRGFVKCAFDTVAGWRLESILKQQRLEEVDFDQVKKSLTLVSGYYSVLWPLRMGELYAGHKNDEWIKELEIYGLNVGLAFQIQDDILGIFGDTKMTGKPVGADLREGKKSYVLMKGFELAGKKEKEVLEQANGNEDLDFELLTQVQKILRDTGALSWAQLEAQQMANMGIRAIKHLETDKNQDSINRLRQLAEFLAARSN
jgi:geranylgeranyl diphosphate synthase, type I